MVRRIFVEKKPGLRHEAAGLLNELRTLLGITALTDLRLVNRYDVEGLKKDVFERAVQTVFSEPQVDFATETLPEGWDVAFAVESLPGQFDQRADSASQCIQLMTQGERPTVRTAKVYLLSGDLSKDDVKKIKDYVINTSTWELDSAYGTGGVITRTFTGVTFSNIRYNGTYNWNYHKDVCPIIGNYVWMTGMVGGVLKMLKCNLLGNAPTEIFEYDNPFSTLNVGGQYVNGGAVVLPNGDFIKTPSANSNDSSVWGKALLYHNDKFYASRAMFDFAGAGAYDT